MKREHAYEAIKAILAAIDDDELPTPSRVEMHEGVQVVWINGIGRHIGSGKRNGRREPLIYRDSAARKAIDEEAFCRIDIADMKAEATA